MEGFKLAVLLDPRCLECIILSFWPSGHGTREHTMIVCYLEDRTLACSALKHLGARSP
jgi:hypothetical protein